MRRSKSRRADSNRLPLPQLRVCGQALQELAWGCYSRISKRFTLLWVAACCTVLRSRWCQSGVRICRLAYIVSLGPYPQAGELWRSSTLQDPQSVLDRRADGSRMIDPPSFGLEPMRKATLPSPTRVYVPVARHREHEQSVGDQPERNSAQQPRSQRLSDECLQRSPKSSGLLRIVLQRRAD